MKQNILHKTKKVILNRALQFDKDKMLNGIFILVPEKWHVTKEREAE